VAGLLALRRWTAARTPNLEPSPGDQGWADPLTPSDRRLLEAALGSSGEDAE